jgi:hypothetical protein
LRSAAGGCGKADRSGNPAKVIENRRSDTERPVIEITDSNVVAILPDLIEYGSERSRSRVG